MYRYCLPLLLAFCCSAAEPVLVVLERNPWLMVIGSDSPTFALYDDGTVIWQRAKPTKEEPFSRGTTSNAQAALDEMIPFDLTKFADRYSLTAWSDQPTTVIWTRQKAISIYGTWRQPPPPPEKPAQPSGKAAAIEERMKKDSLPEEIRASLLRIDEQRKHEGSAWFPEQVEVMFWPYGYAPEESIIWPKKWPGLAAATTVKRGDDSYSVFLPTDDLAKLREFLATRKPRGAIVIDGQKMAASFRLPFPGEKRWMNH